MQYLDSYHKDIIPYMYVHQPNGVHIGTEKPLYNGRSGPRFAYFILGLWKSMKAFKLFLLWRWQDQKANVILSFLQNAQGSGGHRDES